MVRGLPLQVAPLWRLENVANTKIKREALLKAQRDVLEQAELLCSLCMAANERRLCGKKTATWKGFRERVVRGRRLRRRHGVVKRFLAKARASVRVLRAQSMTVE